METQRELRGDVLRLAAGVHALFGAPAGIPAREAALFIAYVLLKHAPDLPEVIR